MNEQQDVQGGGVLPPGVQGGIVAPAGGAPGAGGAVNFTDHGGPVITNAHLVLIFWGTSWGGTPPVSVASVVGAVGNIVSGPYMDWLSQYRSIGHASVQSSVTVTSAVGSSPADPPSPFSDSDVSTLITNLINAGTVPTPASDSQLLYMVLMPTGVSSGGSFVGEHTYFNFNGTNCHFGWVTNSGTLNGITPIFSHELVESVTDPEGSAILGDAGSCNQGGWCEIGDVCTGNNVTINGVLVQRYWSQSDGTCAPTDKQVKDQKDFKDFKEHKPEIKEQKLEFKEHKDAKDTKDHKPEWKEHKDHKPEIKEHKDIKDVKPEWKEHKEPKELKEKEFKEPKEFKDVVEKDPAEIKSPKEVVENPPIGQPGDPSELLQRLDNLTTRVSSLENTVASGQAFIQQSERPPVGEQIVKEEDSTHE